MADRKKTGGKSKGSSVLLIAVAVILCAAAGILFAVRQTAETASQGGQGSTVSTAGSEAEHTDSDAAQVISEGDCLVIPISDLSRTVRFYPVEIDGTRMEVLAVIDSEGNIRTAFNTCQICYSSGRGYYVQSGNSLICQNCGNRFTVDQIEVETGGCNPWPIFPENKTVTGDTVEISYDFLREAKTIFSHWKS